MTTTLWCLFIVVLLPFLLSVLGHYHRAKQLGQIDNKNPRLQATQLTGIGARIYAAQSNAWEAIMLFAPAALTSVITGVDPEVAAPWAIAFVAARVLHAVFYITDQDKLRSLAFIGSMVCTITLFLQAA
tara:strand:+ start:2021 stop:2407 length:387 start_codon:yes stop_codon:yes gene_type:complete